VDLVVTEQAFFFFNIEYNGRKPIDTIQKLMKCRGENNVPMLHIYRDEDEWKTYKKLKDDVLHIELVKRNKVLILAPMSANTLASIALGLCSNLLTCVARAWHYDLDPPPVKSNQEIADKKNAVATSCDGAWASRPVVAAPAMNTYMWHQRITQTHIHVSNESSNLVPRASF